MDNLNLAWRLEDTRPACDVTAGWREVADDVRAGMRQGNYDFTSGMKEMDGDVTAGTRELVLGTRHIFFTEAGRQKMETLRFGQLLFLHHSFSYSTLFLIFFFCSLLFFEPLLFLAYFITDLFPQPCPGFLYFLLLGLLYAVDFISPLLFSFSLSLSLFILFSFTFASSLFPHLIFFP